MRLIYIGMPLIKYLTRRVPENFAGGGVIDRRLVAAAG